MKFYSIREAFEAMTANYSDTVKKMNEAWAELAAAEKKDRDTRQDRRLTQKARNDAMIETGAAIRACRQKLENIRQESERQFSEIMNAAKSSCGKRYRPNVADFDTKALAMVDADIMSVPEMMRFVDDNEIRSISTLRAIGRKFLSIAETKPMTDAERQQLQGRAYQLLEAKSAFDDQLAGLYTILSAATRTDEDLARNIQNTCVSEKIESAMQWAENESES